MYAIQRGLCDAARYASTGQSQSAVGTVGKPERFAILHQKISSVYPPHIFVPAPYTYNCALKFCVLLHLSALGSHPSCQWHHLKISTTFPLKNSSNVDSSLQHIPLWVVIAFSGTSLGSSFFGEFALFNARWRLQFDTCAVVLTESPIILPLLSEVDIIALPSNSSSLCIGTSCGGIEFPCLRIDRSPSLRYSTRQVIQALDLPSGALSM